MAFQGTSRALEPSTRSMCWRRCAWSARMDAQGEPEKTHMGHPRMAFGKIAGGSRRESRTSTPTESPAENLEPTLTVLESPLLDLDNRPRTLDSRSFGNSLHLLTGLPRASGTGFPLSTGSTAAGTARSWGGSFKGMTRPRRQSIWPEGARPPGSEASVLLHPKGLLRGAGARHRPKKLN